MKSDVNMSLDFNLQNFPVLQITQMHHSYHYAKMPDFSAAQVALGLELAWHSS